MKKAIMEKIQLPIMLVSTSAMFFRSKITLDLDSQMNELDCVTEIVELARSKLTVEPSFS